MTSHSPSPLCLCSLSVLLLFSLGIFLSDRPSPLFITVPLAFLLLPGVIILLTMLLDCEHSITLVTAGQVGSCEGSIFRFSDFDITLNFLGRKVWRIIVSMWEQVFLCTWGLYIQDSWSFLNNRVKSLDSCGYREGAELIIYVLLPSPFSSHLSLL